MKTQYLLPHGWKKLGWVLFILGIIGGAIFIANGTAPEMFQWKAFAIVNKPLIGEFQFLGLVENNLFDEIISLLIISGGLMIAFSRELIEDEFVAKIRTESLLWATYLNYGILIVSLLFVFGGTFFTVLIFNMFTLLIFFVIRFKWMLHKSKKGVEA